MLPCNYHFLKRKNLSIPTLINRLVRLFWSKNCFVHYIFWKCKISKLICPALVSLLFFSGRAYLHAALEEGSQVFYRLFLSFRLLWSAIFILRRGGGDKSTSSLVKFNKTSSLTRSSSISWLRGSCSSLNILCLVFLRRSLLRLGPLMEISLHLCPRH